MSTITEEIVALKQATAEQTAASQALAQEVAGKMGDIEQTVDAKLGEVDEHLALIPQTVRDLFERKYLTIDLVDGDDESEAGPFKTLKAAIESIPDGGTATINLPYDENGIEIEVDTSIHIGSRNIMIIGGYYSMEADGYKPTILKMLRHYNATYNRTSLAGQFRGNYGSLLYLSFVRLCVPRLVPGSELEHNHAGAVFANNISLLWHNYGLSESTVFIDDEDAPSRPMFLVRSGARDGKGSVNDITFSYVNVETAGAYPLFNLQYSSATLRFAVFSSTYSDADGSSVSWAKAFDGLSYGSHGYATNLLAPADITKQPE